MMRGGGQHCSFLFHRRLGRNLHLARDSGLDNAVKDFCNGMARRGAVGGGWGCEQTQLTKILQEVTQNSVVNLVEV